MKLSVFEQRLKELGYMLLDVGLSKVFSRKEGKNIMFRKLDIAVVHDDIILETIRYTEGLYTFEEGCKDFKELETLNKLIEEFFREV